MKKLNAVVLAAVLALSSSMSVFAANAVPNTTTLTTNVPDAEYVLSIPADQEIAFGATETKIGVVEVTNSSSFALGKNLNVTMTYTAFESDAVTTTIPFTVVGRYSRGYSPSSQTTEYSEMTLPSGNILTFEGLSDGTVYRWASQSDQANPSPGHDEYTFSSYKVKVNSTDWGKALGGDYTATITFSAEVVAEA